MKKIINDERISNKTVEVKRDVWAGGYSIYVGGKPLNKINKTKFAFPDQEGNFVDAIIRGNEFKGIYLEVKNVCIELLRPLTLFEIIMAFIPMWVFGLIGVKPGAIPGAVIGMIGALGLISIINVSRRIHTFWLKVLVFVLIIGGVSLIGLAFVGLI